MLTSSIFSVILTFSVFPLHLVAPSLSLSQDFRSNKPCFCDYKPICQCIRYVVWATAKSCRKYPPKYGINILTTGGAADLSQLKPKQSLK